jgi:pimeloyl-ACP methyl ester carboxylesterase
MSEPESRTVDVNGHKARVWEKGRGPKIGYFAGLCGAPRWTPFLETLSKTHHVVVPSLPGFPGSNDYDHLDNLVDWISATLDLLEAAGLYGEDLVASSVGATLALEAAAMSPDAVRRLALLAPLGLHEEAAPVPHIWARKSADMNALLCADDDALAKLQAVPDGEDAVEWNLMVARATAASARLLWPMCDLGLVKRLHRIRQPLLLVWGEADAIVAPSYAEIFAKKVSGPVTTRRIKSAGHLIDIDAPEEAAKVVQEYLLTIKESQRQSHAG